MTEPVKPPEPFLDPAASLACIHCGLCLSSCPTYLESGNENDSPRGRIYQMRAVQDGRLPLSPQTVRHFDLCLGCRACESACPSGVRYGELIEATRAHVERHHSRGLFDWLLRRVLIEGIFPFRRRVQLSLLPARALKAAGMERFLPPFLRRFTNLVPSALAKPEPLPAFSPSTAARRAGTVGFVSGCVMDVMFNRTNWNSIRLLNAAGYDVVTPAGQGCCGALYAHGGNLAAARESARKTMETFGSHSIDFIVINAAGCGSTLKEYGHLLGAEPGWEESARNFSARVRDLSEILAASESFLALLRERSASATRASVGTVTYHDACHLAHAQGIKSAPRELLRAAAGERFVELTEADVCCGSAGSYNLTEPEMAGRLGRRKVEHIQRSGAARVVTANPGCLLQMQSELRNAGAPARAEHLADFLQEMLGTSPAEPDSANTGKASVSG